MTTSDSPPGNIPSLDPYQNSNMSTAMKSKKSSNYRPILRKELSITSLNGQAGDLNITHGNQLGTSIKTRLMSSPNAQKPLYPTSRQSERQIGRGKHAPLEQKYWTNFFTHLFREGVWKSTVFSLTPAPIIVYCFPYIICSLHLLFLIKHVRTSG